MDAAGLHRLDIYGIHHTGRDRGDFSPDELTESKPLYYRQEDNLMGKVTYRMRIMSASSDRLVFGVENVSTVWRLLALVFHPGELQSIHFLERESDDVWRYYGILRTGRDASPLIAGHDASLPLHHEHAPGNSICRGPELDGICHRSSLNPLWEIFPISKSLYFDPRNCSYL